MHGVRFGFTVESLDLRFQGFRFRVQGIGVGVRVQGLESRVFGLGFRGSRSTKTGSKRGAIVWHILDSQGHGRQSWHV